MKATDANLLAFINAAPQFVIPIYQRTYSWTEKECRQLWDDILRAGRSDHIPVHFLGSVVYIEESLSNASSRAPLLVIDGQQRLTSVSLLLAALANALGDSEPVDGFSRKKIRNRYLMDPDETGERQFKLLLSKTDRTTLNSVVAGDEFPEPASYRVKENFRLFSDWLSGDNTVVADICAGLAKLMIVDVALSREHDNPQLIFESMNSTGKELSQADLIRNFILMGLEPKLQTRLYEQYWRKMEEGFGQIAYASHFDSFMRHYLAVATGNLPRRDDVYEAFKDYSRRKSAEGKVTEDLVQELRKFARFYCAIALGQEADQKLNTAFKDLRELRVDVSYPFLLEVYADFEDGLLDGEDFHKIVRLIESYVFRRAVCAVPTNSLNKTFATFSRSLKKDRYLESVMAHFMNMKSYRRFPRDEEFASRLIERDLYNFRSRSYWLRRFENYGRKERVHVDDYTIEHILPQNDNLSPAWRSSLGADWKSVQEKWLHTIGNLTLTGYNSEMSDRPFQEKRDMEGGFKESPLRVNKGLAGIDFWNEAAILDRAKRMVQHAVVVWTAPELSPSILESYQSQPEKSEKYSIEDHPNLAGGVIRDLFEGFRREVTALDPCVSEEFLKLYVAYKAETNFVDVVPQAKALRISLNIDLPDLNDPHNLAMDVSSVGRWGNGNTEVKMTCLEQLPYVIGLVRQSLDRQLGEGSAI
ncbi:DUF262 and DUF1524 domain-containing protein [Thalassobius sp. Cn5-15]|uniref:DUF262 and DUF1524 domain-containing protein n=1 Tax=Thalassobius sp. Cn5-15 TaxID=2917763 RepID=UPI001EF2177A|nr:DUF262 and DUF1524 domain-containing protein [Thalassobius sp. Cn5-15]MCG7495200.1 DUF262 and DUF1524 domain-containing protein [Thalassobius sp. Cn5-15]